VQGGSTVSNGATICLGSTIDNATIDNATVCNSTISNQTIQNLTMSESVAPTVSSVSSDNSSAGYSIGSNISVYVVFDESLFVDNSTGNPRILLETGSTDRYANYISTSDNGSVLYFIYTVVSGDNSTDLDYKSTSSLSDNGSTIRDNSSNDATLTLPSPGSTGSLGANRNIVIDTTAPTMTFDPADTEDGVTVSNNITITFNEPVRLDDSSELTGNLQALITLQYVSGASNIAKAAAISSNKKVITINPDASLNTKVNVRVGIGATVEDYAGNVITATSVIFETD
jgi:hypothetical protein